MTPNSTTTFVSSVNTTDQEFIDVLFEHLVNTEGLGYRAIQSRTLAEGASFDQLAGDSWAVIADVEFRDKYRSVLYRHVPTGSLFVFGMSGRGASFTFATRTAEIRAQLIKHVLQIYPPRQIPPDKEEVFVQFWSLTPNGARGVQRTIAINPWQRVKDNYTPATVSGLSSLMTNFKPSKAGQLILWYGPPGTGKTHALRALAWEWRKWCTYHFITDPEVFFGGQASYMLDVLLLQGMPPVYGTADDDDEEELRDQAKGKWRLLILEDSGELMVPDAKTQTGQGLSRLLNVVDGLIGQGLRIMVLVTTNEILKKLHPAVARPGRCAARIEFAEFTKQEAGLWLKERGHEAHSFELADRMSLADLYSKTGDEQTIVESQRMPVGFNS